MMHCRFQRSIVRRSYPEKSRKSSGPVNKKQVNYSTSYGDVPSIDIREDNDMYFPSVRVDWSLRQMVGQDTVNDGLDFGTFSGDDIHLDGPSSIG